MDKTDIDARLDRIAAKLGTVVKGGYKPFGAAGHGFRLRPPLTKEQVYAFERRYSIGLPPEYWAFITRELEKPTQEKSR